MVLYLINRKKCLFWEIQLGYLYKNKHKIFCQNEPWIQYYVQFDLKIGTFLKINLLTLDFDPKVGRESL